MWRHDWIRCLRPMLSPSPSRPLIAIKTGWCLFGSPADQSARIAALLDHFYPYRSRSEEMRLKPCFPLLIYAPSAWELSLEFAVGA